VSFPLVESSRAFASLARAVAPELARDDARKFSPSDVDIAAPRERSRASSSANDRSEFGSPSSPPRSRRRGVGSRIPIDRRASSAHTSTRDARRAFEDGERGRRARASDEREEAVVIAREDGARCACEMWARARTWTEARRDDERDDVRVD